MSTNTYSRRDMLRCLNWMFVGTAAAACTPLRILTQSFPEGFKRDPQLVSTTLDAFVVAVIPGAAGSATEPARALLDPHYPFARYAAFFASDLAERSHAQFGREFTGLTADERVAVISAGLEADTTTRKLYRGAIFLTQVSIYAGIYDDAGGCRRIDFPGAYHGAEISYADAASFLPPSLTASGNCV